MSFYKYRAKLIRVVDGDTYDFEVDLGFHTFTRIRIRMSGIDTAETYGVKHESDEYARGIEQKEFVEDWFKSAEDVIIETEKDEKGKYGRWLARVYESNPDNEDSECLNERLIEEFDVANDY